MPQLVVRLPLMPLIIQLISAVSELCCRVDDVRSFYDLSVCVATGSCHPFRRSATMQYVYNMKGEF